MYYEGDTVNRITIGRNMGWAAISSIVLNGNVTCNSSASISNSINITGATNTAQSLMFRSTDYNLGIAGSAGNYSSSALQNDMILRTLTNTNLILQSGSGGHGLKIDSANNISCSGNINVGVATNYSTATKMNIKGSSSGYSQPLVRIEQTAGWDGNYCLQTVGYSDFNGIRINGADTGNTIYTTGANDMGLTTNAGAMKFTVNGAERMRISNNGNVSVSNDFTVNSTLNCSTAYINGNCTAYKYYVVGETYSYIVNWNGTGVSGLFVSLNQFWYTGHADLNVAIYVQNVGGNDNSNCWFGRILLSTNNNGTAPAMPGGIIQIITDYRNPSTAASNNNYINVKENGTEAETMRYG